jgi:hypothetical protein
MWQGAWRIAKYEFNLAWRGYLVTILVLAYTSFFTSVLLYAHLSSEISPLSAWGLDLGYFCMLPLFGFLMDQTTFRYRREDTYSRKLAEWHTMPIGVGQIIAGRLMLLILVFIADWLLYFGVQYAAFEELRELLNPAEYVIYALTWFGYGVIASTLMVFMELGFSGRVYFGFCFIFVFFMLTVTLLLTVNGKSAVMLTLEEAAGGHWEIAAISVAAAAMAAGGFGALLHRRINRRSFWI